MPDFRVPTVHLKRDCRLRDRFELGARTRAENDDRAINAVVDWEDLDPSLELERNAAYLAGIEK